MIKTDKQVKPQLISERRFVELPLLEQLGGLGWTIIDLEMKQKPHESHREHFTEVVMKPILKDSLKKINPWLEEDQVDELVRRITTFPQNTLLENNQYQALPSSNILKKRSDRFWFSAATSATAPIPKNSKGACVSILARPCLPAAKPTLLSSLAIVKKAC